MKPLEDTNFAEIVQLLRLLQEAVRISADAELAQAKFQYAAQQVTDAQSSSLAKGAQASSL